MSTLLFANNAASTVAGAITNTLTTVHLAAGGGALFPTPTSGQYFVITFTDAATGLLNEIAWCTNRSTDTLTIVRAQEGTTALNWNAGDLVDNLWTAGQAAQMVQQGQVPTGSIYYGTDTGSVNNIVTTVSPTIGALTTGNIFEISVAYANTQSIVDLTITEIGTAHQVYRSNGTSLLLGDFQGPPYKALIAWDGTTSKYLLLNPYAPAQQNATGATFYINANTGSDSNDGLTSGTAFQTFPGAITAIDNNYLSTGTVTLSVSAGSYNNSAKFASTSISNWVVIGAGNGSNPSSNTVITSSGGAAVSASGSNTLTIENCMMVSSSNNAVLHAFAGSQVVIYNCSFTGLSSSGIVAQSGAYITLVGNCNVYGSYTSVLLSQFNATLVCGGATGTGPSIPLPVGSLLLVFSGVTASVGMAVATDLACIKVYVSVTSASGSPTGPAYSYSGISVIDATGWGGSNLFGASAAGTGTNGAYLD